MFFARSDLLERIIYVLLTKLAVKMAGYWHIIKSNILSFIHGFNHICALISLGLKMMVNTLLASMKMLWDVLILTMFFICIFALVGMQVFGGVLRNKCGEPVPENLQISYRNYASNSSEYFMKVLWSFRF